MTLKNYQKLMGMLMEDAIFHKHPEKKIEEARNVYKAWHAGNLDKFYDVVEVDYTNKDEIVKAAME